ncbi:AzlC family ABC transporter permease [Paenibacillus glycanilyticus]|uniref:Branched-chain amino acid ABC transporter permease n=1 Tax=Paenibacillus glycanilyticus TaxID=126569 RepID=A0ABQ6GLG6_9BACL|nr:AzlC family ABC transporter permease [Paenibacillus glycanilyticus]GLX70461.1 branched-chain amino acid ABC transporter permease [Paenibacillus glycanilyticus]
MQQENVQLRMAMDENSFLQGVKDCIPTLLGYLSIGFAAGVVGHTSGLSVLEITLMSILIYAGSAQFIIAGMVASHGSVAAIVFTVFIVNLRHLLLSAALSPYFRHLSAFKTIMIGTLLTDETFGVAINRAANTRALGESWMNGLNVTAYLNWILATAAGAFLGQWITNPEKFGLDFALSAMFIGLLVLQLIGRQRLFRDLIVVVSAVIIVVGTSMVTSGSIAVIIATISAATIGVLIERWK